MKDGIKGVKKVFFAVALSMVVLLTGNRLSTMQVTAGSSDILIDNSSFEKEIDSSKWHVPNEDIIVEDGKLVFLEDSTGSSRIITISAATKSAYHNELFRADYTLNLKKIPEGKRFIAAFSLASIESISGEEGNLEIIFQKDNGIKVSILAYDDNAKPITLVDNVNCGIREGKKFQLHVDVTTDSKLNIVVNNRTLYDANAPIEMNGRLGFLQTGECSVEISKVDIVYHRYERPENANISEDFENGTFNLNTLASKMIYSREYFPNGIHVEDYNGNKVLMFRNVNCGYFGTKYQYSNCEISFDVPYMVHEDVVNEDGTIRTMAHSAFVVGIGDDTINYETATHGYYSSTEGIVFTTTDVASLKKMTNPVSIKDKNYFDPDKQEGYSVKVSVVDAQITVYIKALEADKYDQIMQYKTGSSTPVGYIHIFANGQSNFGIDNFKITNLDKEANLLNVEYQESFLTGTEDWEYEPMEEVYMSIDDTEKEFNWALVPVYALGVGVIIVAICIMIAKMQKVRKKGEGVYED